MNSIKGGEGRRLACVTRCTGGGDVRVTAGVSGVTHGVTPHTLVHSLLCDTSLPPYITAHHTMPSSPTTEEAHSPVSPHMSLLRTCSLLPLPTSLTSPPTLLLSPCHLSNLSPPAPAQLSRCLRPVPPAGSY